MIDWINEFFCKILEWILKHAKLLSIIFTTIVIILWGKYIINYFAVNKEFILNMLIGISGTLFGFVLTFLSIFIVFRTDEKYKIDEENQWDPLILYVNNTSFNEIYELFMVSSNSLGTLVLISIIYSFTSYGLNYCINFGFILIIIWLIVLSSIRVMLSIYSFNELIKILISKNK